MKLLLLLASPLMIAIPNVHSRILQWIMNAGGKKLDMMIIRIYGRQPRSPPPSPTSSPGIFHSAGRDKFETSIISSAYGRQKTSPPPYPFPSPSKRQSARGTISSPCDHDIITIRAPPPPINSASRDESDTIISSVSGREGPTLPPPAPENSPGIVTLGMCRSTPPSLICMPGRPCPGGFIYHVKMIKSFAELTTLPIV